MPHRDPNVAFPVFKIALASVWLIVPLICFLLRQVPDWIYSDERTSPLPFFWEHIAAIVALAWAAYFLVMLFSFGHFDYRHQDLRSLAKIAAGGIFWSWLASGGIGGLAFGLVNCACDSSEGQATTVKKVKEEPREVIFRIETPFPATFKCGLGLWNTGDVPGKRFFVYPGRLGVVWGEFR